MHTQTYEKACDLAGRFVEEIGAQLLIGETADEELALYQGEE